MNDPEVSLPVNEDAERLVLGCILLNDARLQDADRLCPDDFYFDRHRRIFRCMRELHVRGEAINPATVAEELRRKGDAASENLPWLMSLCKGGIPQTLHLNGHVNIVARKSALRQMISEGRRLIEECQADAANLETILDSHSTRTEQLRAVAGTSATGMHRVEDLESIFAKRASTEYTCC